MEFGTSFSISTMYLAAAMTDNGAGHVLAQAGVAEAVTILAGDALETLASLGG